MVRACPRLVRWAWSDKQRRLRYQRGEFGSLAVEQRHQLAVAYEAVALRCHEGVAAPAQLHEGHRGVEGDDRGNEEGAGG